MRLTTPLNLPAPGRRQTLYVVFDLAEPCVFSKQSLGAFHCDSPSLCFARKRTTASTPSSEVTVLICRVPSRGITHAPWNTLPVYLCRFAVRTDKFLTYEDFLGSMITVSLRAKPSRSHLGLKEMWIYLHFQPTCLDHLIQQVADFHFCVPPYGRTIITRYRNINLFSITYAFQPRLRDRLTLR